MNCTQIALVPLCLIALAGAVAGCGDASADGGSASKCEQMCQHGDSCPNLYAPSDCAAECEAAVAEAKTRGGSCPGTLDAVIACHTQLSCGELQTRALSRFYDDECVAKERAAALCIPGEPIGDEPEDDELTLACAAVCDAVNDCPRAQAEPTCVDICVADWRRAQNGAESCNGAIIDSLSCQAAMSCAEIENRILGRDYNDSCRVADNAAQNICFSL